MVLSLVRPLSLSGATTLLLVLASFLFQSSHASECGKQGGNRLCPDPNECCSEFGFCDIGDSWCGKGCQNGPCYETPAPTPPPVAPIPVMDLIQPPNTARATSDDSRVIAYVGNWQTCPTVSQTDGYTHIVVAFAVTYTFSSWGNQCDEQCNVIDATSGLPITTGNVGSSVKVCNEQANQDLVYSWKNAGKKVILSFGGAGMGGSWGGDQNNCWDHCFGREDQLSTALVNIVQKQNFDGIDIDYEYCYDKESGRHNGCWQTSDLYSDGKARTFLKKLTEQLRWKLDMLGEGYELTHAPMDSDLVVDSPYYQILKEQSDNLDFLMPQFYNGITRPASTDGFDSKGVGTTATSTLYSNLVNDMFNGRADKVVFGFCISDCGGSRSNVNGNEAVSVLQQIKTYNNGEFSCNGGAFFWLAFTDERGSWSDPVWEEVRKTSGCSTIRNSEAVPIKFDVKGLPEIQQEKELIDIEMRTLFSRIMLGLEERVVGLKILGIEENDSANNNDWISMGEATMYYIVNVEGDDYGRDVESVIIQELRVSHDDILDEVSFSDMMYIGKDLEYNWCTKTEFETYSRCVHENFDEMPAMTPLVSPGTQSVLPSGAQPVSSPTVPSEVLQSNNANNLDSDDGLPGWAIALIFFLCLLILGCIGYFAFKKRKNGTSQEGQDDIPIKARIAAWIMAKKVQRAGAKAKERQGDIYTEAFEDNISVRSKPRITDQSRSNAKKASADEQSVMSGWSKADQKSVTSAWTKHSESIEHASYGSKRVNRTSRVTRDPSIYIAGREDADGKSRVSRDPSIYIAGREDPGYLPVQYDKPDPDSSSVSGNVRIDPDSASMVSYHSGNVRIDPDSASMVSYHRHSSEEPSSTPMIDP